MPAWRNWQTRWTQNPVSVEDVSVRPRSPVFLETVRNSKVREIGLFSLQLQLKTVRNREVFAIYLQSAYFDLLRILEKLVVQKVVPK